LEKDADGNEVCAHLITNLGLNHFNAPPRRFILGEEGFFRQCLHNKSLFLVGEWDFSLSFLWSINFQMK
jgi:hypothetical protein